MPAWDPKANDIFCQALECDTAIEQQSLLDEACGDDARLRQNVERMLSAHQDVGSFLEQPAWDTTPVNLATTPPDGSSLPSDSTQFPAIQSHDLSLDFLTPADAPEALGRLDQYEVVEVLGYGGMGIVLKARDTRLNRIVAIKVLAPALAASPAAHQRFVREAQAAAAVRHDHVVTIHGVGETEGLPFLVMEYVAGVSLQQRIDRDGPLPLKEILCIGMQTAAGLAAAHAQGLIHRDVKPANILLQDDVERVKITDFGLARSADDVSLTQAGAVAGTPQYMSPEQARGDTVDYRTDLFSLGSVLYAMCTGQAPFRASTTMGMLRQVCDDKPRAIGELNPAIPNWVIAIVEQLHAKDPTERFQSAAEVAELLSECLAHVEQPSVTPLPAIPGVAGTIKPPRFRRFLAAATVLLVIAVGLGFSEAAGLTQFVPMMIRIVTGEGTLVVQVDDPDVSVLIDGEEISIKGAGPHEIRLRPGRYKFRAAKDGKLVREELVRITRGDKRLVKVSREPAGKQLAPDEIRRFAPYWGTVMCVAVSPDGQRALFGGEDTVVWLVDLAGKDKPRAFEGHTKMVQSVAFSPDGRRALSGGQDATVRLWDLESGQELRQFEGHSEVVWRVAVSPDGRMAASGGGGQFKDGQLVAGNDNAVRLWDVEAGKELRRLFGHKGYVLSIAFSPDGKRALTGCSNEDPIIRLWDVATGNELGRLEGHTMGAYKLVYSADGRRVLSAGADRTIRLWDVETKKTIGRFLGHTSDVTGVAFSPDHRYCVSSSWDKTIRLWDVESGKELHRFEGHTGAIRDVAFTPNGRSVLSGAEDGTVRLWRVPEKLTNSKISK